MHNFSNVYCPQLFTFQTFNHLISLHTEYILLIVYVKVFVAFISLDFIILEKLISNKILRCTIICAMFRTFPRSIFLDLFYRNKQMFSFLILEKIYRGEWGIMERLDKFGL